MITFRVGGAGDLSPYSVVLVSLLDHVLRTPGLPVSIVLAGGCSARKSIEQFEQDDDRKNVRGDCRKKGKKVQWLGRGLLQNGLVLLEGHCKKGANKSRVFKLDLAQLLSEWSQSSDVPYPSPSRCQNDRGPGPLPTPAMPLPFPPPPPPRPCTTTTIPFLFWLGEPTAKPRPHSPPRLTTANWSVVVVAT